jgi:hypothetical protein
MTSDFFHLHSTAQDALARLANTRPGQPVRVAVTARLATARHLLALEMESFLAEAGRRPPLSCCPAAETGRAASGRVPDSPAPCYLLVISDDRCPVGMAGHAANIVLLLDPQAANQLPPDEGWDLVAAPPVEAAPFLAWALARAALYPDDRAPSNPNWRIRQLTFIQADQLSALGLAAGPEAAAHEAILRAIVGEPGRGGAAFERALTQAEADGPTAAIGTAYTVLSRLVDWHLPAHTLQPYLSALAARGLPGGRLLWLRLINGLARRDPRGDAGPLLTAARANARDLDDKILEARLPATQGELAWTSEDPEITARYLAAVHAVAESTANAEWVVQTTRGALLAWLAGDDAALACLGAAVDRVERVPEAGTRALLLPLIAGMLHAQHRFSAAERVPASLVAEGLPEPEATMVRIENAEAEAQAGHRAEARDLLRSALAASEAAGHCQQALLCRAQLVKLALQDGNEIDVRRELVEAERLAARLANGEQLSESQVAPTLAGARLWLAHREALA